MLSWCPIKGPVPPGGYESRRGLLLVDSSVREALDFEAKLHGYSTALRGGGGSGGLCMDGTGEVGWVGGGGVQREKVLRNKSTYRIVY